MTAADEITLARRFYGAHGDRAMITEVMASDVVWDITPGFPLGGVYIGLDAVLGEFLRGVGQMLASVSTVPEQFFADGSGHVTVLGRYLITGRSGRSVDSRFVHIWTIEDAKLAYLKQTADTALLAELW